jgi:hypothetical protein
MKITKYVSIALVLGLSISFTGCGKKEAEATAAPTPTPTPTPTPDSYAAPAGTYFSETTGLPIAESLKDQRPIAVMVDCEYSALPHYGLAEADIVYDLMNSLENERITRFMAVYKDYDSVAQIGNVRSARTTNVWLAAEWNAILCHDGEAIYAEPYLESGYGAENLSGGFSRIDNGKATEFTEYILPGDVAARASESGVNLKYNEYKVDGDHFQFAKYTLSVDTTASSFTPAISVSLPYDHNGTSLAYNADTKTYDLSMYGILHQDGDDGQTLTFQNVLLLDAPYTEYPSGGLIYYDIVDSTGDGYYLTNGVKEAITWKKSGETGIMHYYDASGKELTMNRGKSYISFVPGDVWGAMIVE